MSKPLSEMIEASEPELKGTWHKLDNYYAECILPETKNTTSLVTLEDYDRMKRVAIVLSQAIQHLEEANRRLINWEFAQEPYVKISHEYKNQINAVVKEVKDRAKDIIGDNHG